ncbi:MAG: hypothetical protein QOG21_1953 [Actinomycetota bacterium]|nr:hypothetical protein [Actinomycetota bacterium]
MDVGTVHAYADGFALAVVADDTGGISGYLIGDIGNAYLYVDHRFGGKARNCRGADLIDAESNVA